MNRLNLHRVCAYDMAQNNRDNIIHEYETARELYIAVALCHATRYAGPMKDVLELRLLEEWLKMHHDNYIEACRRVPYRRVKE